MSCRHLGSGASCASCVSCRAHWHRTDRQEQLRSRHSCHMSYHGAKIHDVKSRDGMSHMRGRHRGAYASSFS